MNRRQPNRKLGLDERIQEALFTGKLFPNLQDMWAIQEQKVKEQGDVLRSLDKHLNALLDRRIDARPNEIPTKRAISLLNVIGKVITPYPYFGIEGGSLMERNNGDYRVIAQFGNPDPLFTGYCMEKKDLPLEELRKTPVIFRHDSDRTPYFLRKRTIIALDKGLDYLVALKQKDDIDPYVGTIRETISHIGMDARRYMRSRARQSEVESELAKRNAELKVAHGIQEGLIEPMDPFEGYDIGDEIRFAEEVGGDYRLGKQHGDTYRIVLSDVTGHGLPASLLSRTIRDLLRENKGEKAVTTMSKINRALCDEKDDYFASSVLMELQKNGDYAYINNGHLPLPYSFYDGKCIPLDGSSPILGVIKGIENEIYTGHMRRGEIIVLGSDGITETFNPGRKEQWEEKRLIDYVLTHSQDSADQIVNGIYKEVEMFSGKRPAEDDRTLIVVKRL